MHYCLSRVNGMLENQNQQLNTYRCTSKIYLNHFIRCLYSVNIFNTFEFHFSFPAVQKLLTLVFWFHGNEKKFHVNKWISHVFFQMYTVLQNITFDTIAVQLYSSITWNQNTIQNTKKWQQIYDEFYQECSSIFLEAIQHSMYHFQFSFKLYVVIFTNTIYFPSLMMKIIPAKLMGNWFLFLTFYSFFPLLIFLLVTRELPNNDFLI